MRQLENVVPLAHGDGAFGQHRSERPAGRAARREQRRRRRRSWISALEREAESQLNRGETGIIDELTRQFEKALILRALAHTGGRRIEAAHLLGLGRNTLTRKIQELKIDGETTPSDEVQRKRAEYAYDSHRHCITASSSAITGA